MIGLPSETRVWLASGATDMRRGFDGLALVVQETLKRNPHCGHLFVFQRRRDSAMGADLRRIAPGARIMLHQSRASLESATAEVLRSILADLDVVDRLVAAIFSHATRRTPECVAAWEQASTTFDAREAIAAGLAHEPIGSGVARWATASLSSPAWLAAGWR